MQATIQKEHQWLDKFIGEWTSEMECSMGPDRPPSKTTGTEAVRSLGGIWIVAEGECETPDGPPGQTIMSLCYDPQTDRYVGTFIASMMTHLWIYNGSLNEDKGILTLDTKGPNFSHSSMTQYKDIIEFVDNDHRILTSQILMDDVSWNQFMTAHYRRK